MRGSSTLPSTHGRPSCAQRLPMQGVAICPGTTVSSQSDRRAPSPTSPTMRATADRPLVPTTTTAHRAGGDSGARTAARSLRTRPRASSSSRRSCLALTDAALQTFARDPDVAPRLRDPWPAPGPAAKTRLVPPEDWLPLLLGGALRAGPSETGAGSAVPRTSRSPPRQRLHRACTGGNRVGDSREARSG